MKTRADLTDPLLPPLGPGLHSREQGKNASDYVCQPRHLAYCDVPSAFSSPIAQSRYSAGPDHSWTAQVNPRLVFWLQVGYIRYTGLEL